MAKTTAPLLSFEARGSIAETVVYSRRQGTRYAKRRFSPADPKSPSQLELRSIFSYLQHLFHAAPPDVQTPWQLYAKTRKLSAHNVYLAQNINGLRQGAGLENLRMGHAHLAGPRSRLTSVTPGDGEVTVNQEIPTDIAPGLTLFSRVATAIENADPRSAWPAQILTAAVPDAGTPLIIGPIENREYLVSSWLVWTRPDGRRAYSAPSQEIIDLRYTVDEYALSPQQDYAQGISMVWTVIRLIKFNLPAHMDPLAIQIRIGGAGTPKKWQLALYSENGQTKIATSTEMAAPTASTTYNVPWALPFHLNPGNYWLGLLATESGASMAATSTTLPAANPFGSQRNALNQPLTGFLTPTVNGQFPATFNPLALTGNSANELYNAMLLGHV